MDELKLTEESEWSDDMLTALVDEEGRISIEAWNELGREPRDAPWPGTVFRLTKPQAIELAQWLLRAALGSVPKGTTPPR